MPFVSPERSRFRSRQYESGCPDHFKSGRTEKTGRYSGFPCHSCGGKGRRGIRHPMACYQLVDDSMFLKLSIREPLVVTLPQAATGAPTPFAIHSTRSWEKLEFTPGIRFHRLAPANIRDESAPTSLHSLASLQQCHGLRAGLRRCHRLWLHAGRVLRRPSPPRVKGRRLSC